MASLFKKAACAVAAFAVAAGMSGCGQFNEPAQAATVTTPVLKNEFAKASTAYVVPGQYKSQDLSVVEFTPKTAPGMTCVSTLIYGANGYSEPSTALACFPKTPAP